MGDVPGFSPVKDEKIHGTINDPIYTGPRAKTYPFVLDPFQEISVACLERNESVLVSAHTSAGKTAVAEYAIAMAFRDKQRVIYTSPLKALSNQKYRELSEEFSDVGLMTGDVSIAPNASCIVMTTEILRGMLYKGSEVLREVAWVVFDEIHYMRDRERGVVWEESIIFLPPEIKMVFLSATMSNATEFAEWICHLHKQPCHVVYTDFRPTPLQHYAFPVGGSGLYLVVDEKGQFKEDSFMRLNETFSREKVVVDGVNSPNTPGGRGGRSGRSRGGGGRGRGDRGGTGSSSDIYKIVKVRILLRLCCYQRATYKGLQGYFLLLLALSRILEHVERKLTERTLLTLIVCLTDQHFEKESNLFIFFGFCMAKFIVVGRELVRQSSVSQYHCLLSFQMIMERKFQPVIVFSFSRRECEQYALSMSKLDFNTDDEKATVEEVFTNAIQVLSDEDRSLPAIDLILPLLKRGIGVHHSGLLPILKEVIEILFQEGLCKALFATETVSHHNSHIFTHYCGRM